MILCLKCKRLWPRGTTWCGYCRATLGKRICDKGHESPLTASNCTGCGSRKLTPAVSSLNLRPLVWMVVAIVGWLGWPLVGLLMQSLLSILFSFILDQVVPVLLLLFLLSWAIGHIFGKKVSKLIHELWEEVLKLIFKGTKSLVKSLVKSVEHRENHGRLHKRRHD